MRLRHFRAGGLLLLILLLLFGVAPEWIKIKSEIENERTAETARGTHAPRLRTFTQGVSPLPLLRYCFSPWNYPSIDPSPECWCPCLRFAAKGTRGSATRRA